MDNNKYNAQGIALPQTNGSKSPASNPGIVYQGANIPTNPGSFLSGQAIGQLTFQSNYSGRRIRIVMSPGVTPFQDAASIAVIDDQNRIVAQMGGSPIDSELTVIRESDNTSTTPMVVFEDNGSGANNVVLELASKDLLNSHFTPLMAFVNVNTFLTVHLFISDGTNPNGVLSETKGSICLNASASGQIAYNNNGSTGWTLL